MAGSGPRELICSLIIKVGNVYKIAPLNIRVIEQVRHPGPFKLPENSPKQVVSVICFRSSVIPVLEDRKVLDAGYKLDIATRSSGTIELSKAENLYRARQVSGSMSAGERRLLAARIEEMNAQAQSPPASGQSSGRVR